MSDLISRQAAIDVAQKTIENPRVLDRVMLNLYELPSAQPEQKTGKWMPSSRTWSYYNYDCSVCGCNEFRQVDHNGGYKAFNFCPNCGAKMEVEHE